MPVFSLYPHRLEHFTFTNYGFKTSAFPFFIFLLELHFFTYYKNFPFSPLQIFSGLSLALNIYDIFAILGHIQFNFMQANVSCLQDFSLQEDKSAQFYFSTFLVYLRSEEEILTYFSRWPLSFPNPIYRVTHLFSIDLKKYFYHIFIPFYIQVYLQTILFETEFLYQHQATLIFSFTKCFHTW